MTTPTELKPKDGFDWGRVRWGEPTDPLSDHCSLCTAELEDEEMPLMFWNPRGGMAQFCEHCQQLWWGFEPGNG